MWLQHMVYDKWAPRYSVWRESDDLYLCVERMWGRGNPAYLHYVISRSIYKNYRGFFLPDHDKVIITKEIDYRGRSKELNKTWEKIKQDPTSFLLRWMI